MVWLAGVISFFVVTFIVFRINGKTHPAPMSMQLERFFLGNPLRLRFFGPKPSLFHLDDIEGQTVAEIGIGIGVMVEELAQRVGPKGLVWGMDIQRQAIEMTKRRLHDRNFDSRVKLWQGNAIHMPWSERSLDALIMVAMLGELPRDQRVLAIIEAFRVLKPGGRMIISEFWPDPHYLRKPYVLSLLEQAGFVRPEIKSYPMIYSVAVMRP